MTCVCAQQRVEALGSEATPSMKSMVKLFQYLAVVIVQDALELADLAPNNRVYALLLRDERFTCVPLQLATHVHFIWGQLTLSCLRRHVGCNNACASISPNHLCMRQGAQAGLRAPQGGAGV